MKAFRVQRWGSNILPLGPNPPRQCCPLFQRISGYSSSSSSLFQASSFISNATVEAKAAAPTIRKRGRPPKSKSPKLSTTPTAPLPTSLAGTAASLAHDLDYPASIIEPLPKSAGEDDASGSVRSSRTSPPPAKSLVDGDETPAPSPFTVPLEQLPSPPVSAAASSVKLAALHARLSLPSQVPIETLARTLVDKTADQDTRFNNNGLHIIGNELLGVHISEHMLCRYPRLPTIVMIAATRAYVGDKALAALAQEWGIEAAAEPGGEVDPGLLQFKRTDVADATSTVKRLSESTFSKPAKTEHAMSPVATLERASANFVRALLAAVYLHCGSQAAHEYFNSHVLSRQLNVSSLFTFKHPERDLSRLCTREGFEAPVARLLSETGRLTRSPVFVVGIFSGRDKLSEGQGASLKEARMRAAIRALKGWYLYSPVAHITDPSKIPVPSMMEGERGKGKTWEPVFIDDGEIFL